MTRDWQTIVALVIVALAVAFLVRAAISRRRKSNCGVCAPDKFKQSLRR